MEETSLFSGIPDIKNRDITTINSYFKKYTLKRSMKIVRRVDYLLQEASVSQMYASGKALRINRVSLGNKPSFITWSLKMKRFEILYIQDWKADTDNEWNPLISDRHSMLRLNLNDDKVKSFRILRAIQTDETGD